MQTNPRDLEQVLRAADATMRSGDQGKAVEMLEQTFSLPQADVAFTLASIHRANGNAVKAEQAFRLAIAAAPENAEYRSQFALFLYDGKRLDEAISEIAACVRMDPLNPQFANDLGVLFNENRETQRALRQLREAIRLRPDYLVPRVNLGYIHIAAKEIDAAEAVLKDLAVAELDDPEIRSLRKAIDRARADGGKQAADGGTELLLAGRSYKIAPMGIIERFGEDASAAAPGLSVVVPVFNEVENIPLLYGELTAVLGELKQEYEIIFVDDGSRDGSRRKLEETAAADSHVTVIQFRRNYGQTAAMGAGFKYARGDVVITMDADLQNDPADIPRLLEKMAEGYDLVNGWRKQRQDTFVTRRIPSMIANRIINKLIEGTRVQLHDFGCTLKAYKKGIVKNIHLYGEMHRFIPVFAAWLGVEVAEIPVNHRARKYGQAKYGLSRVWRVIFDLIVVRFFSDYMTRPIQFFGKIAKNIVYMGVAALAVLGTAGVVSGVMTIQIAVAVILVLLGILLASAMLLLVMGLLGELMIRFYFEVQHKDSFVVERVIGSRAPDHPA